MKKKLEDYTADDADNKKDQDTDLKSYQEQIQINQIEQPLQEANGLRIIGLNKIYSRQTFGCLKRKEMHAVKDLRLDVGDGELLSILGHNGAGIKYYIK